MPFIINLNKRDKNGQKNTFACNRQDLNGIYFRHKTMSGALINSNVTLSVWQKMFAKSSWSSRMFVLTGIPKSRWYNANKLFGFSFICALLQNFRVTVKEKNALIQHACKLFKKSGSTLFSSRKLNFFRLKNNAMEIIVGVDQWVISKESL